MMNLPVRQGTTLLVSLILAASVPGGLAGCGVNFYAGRPTDVKRIRELSQELERMQVQKEAEARQLRDAYEELQNRLKKEIASRQVKLEMAERGLVLTFVSEVLFDSGKATLRPEASETLSKVAEVIHQKVPDRDVGIEGHTDNEPIKHSGWKSNWELSTTRATSVLHFLEDQGVEPRQMVASGYGEYRPVDSNESAEGKQKNRRVEIVILPKELTKRERELIRAAEASGEPDVVHKAQTLEAYK